jgi:hypothetical protein
MSAQGTTALKSSQVLPPCSAASPSNPPAWSCTPWRRSKYVAYRKAGYLKAWQTRRTPHRVSLFLLDTVVIKEYTGARAAVSDR